ncbi:MAG: hypothetical protein ABSE04_01750 [Candidatus Microgenomates bacterium]|jgi:hypothetical protein
MKSRVVVIGSLIGILVGMVLAFLFPSLLRIGLEFNKIINKGLGYPSNFYLITSGSVYNAYPTVVLVFGLVGAVLGFVASKFTRNRF